MKHHSLLLVFSLALTALLTACDPCKNLDCIASNYSAQFRIVNKTDGKDLVFGSSAVYDKKKIKFYSLKGSDTTFFNYTATNYSGIGFDSILRVEFFPETNIPAYIKLSDTDTDTLAISYNAFKTKCCGTITEITNIRYNNSINVQENQGIREIRK